MKLSSKKSVFRTVYEYAAIILLAVEMAFNYQLLIVENNYAPAGLNGIATMIQYKTGFSIGYSALIINIPLCVAAFFAVEKSMQQELFALLSVILLRT